MKRFIIGFLAGAMIFGTIGAFAVSYVAEPATFKVLVNGKEFVSDPPALVVEGSTYLPLRAIGNALGVPVEWNAELGQAEVGNSTATANQYSRTTPAPLNTAQTYTYTNGYNDNDDYTVSVKVLETIRGEENIAKVRKSVVTDDSPKEGYELMMIKVAVNAVSINGDRAVEPSKYNFTCFTSNNEETDHAYLHMEGENGFNWLEGKIYEGGSTEGWIVVQVKKEDPAPKLAYGLDYQGSGGVWFALN